MAMVKVTSAQESNIPNNLLNRKSGNNFQDSSFSSYLNATEETFVLKLDSSRNLSKKTDDDDEEIDIFSAEKYFNEVRVDQENQEIQENVEPKLDEQKTRPKTPSIHSESSWNSRSQLLHNFSRNHHQQQSRKSNNKSYGKKFFASFGCNCYCKDKEAVAVKENPIKARNLAQSSNHQDLYFKKKYELGLKKDEFFTIQEEKTRKSLDVFGLRKPEKAEEKLSLEKKLSLLTWDAIVPKQEEIDEDQDYAESDASSDLFEIESFPSTNTNNNATTNFYGPSFVRQESDGMSSYAPSEVSIEWSVVTASAADFSLMSDSENSNSSHRIVQTTERSSEKSKRRSSVLLGCNSHKSVGVVGDAYKVSEKTSMEMKHRQIKNESFMPMPMTRFHAESKVMNRFDGGIRKNDFATRSFSSSYAGRPADFLYS